MENWIKQIKATKNSANPIGVALEAVFKGMGRETWFSDPLIQMILKSDDFNNANIYQNQYKTANLIYCGFTLLKEEIKKGFEQHLIIFIFAALFHNFKHAGRINKYPFENEKNAIEQMYVFAQKNSLMKLWSKHPWSGLKNMPSWVNSTDAIEELIFCADFSDIKNISKLYLTNPEDSWRADLPVQINKLKQIFLESLLLPNVLSPFFIEENIKMMSENDIVGANSFMNRQIKIFLQNFAIHIYISKASNELQISDAIQKNINSL